MKCEHCGEDVDPAEYPHKLLELEDFYARVNQAREADLFGSHWYEGTP